MSQERVPLRYKVFYPVKDGKAINVLDDGGPELLLDLRTVIEWLGMSWHRWALLCRHNRRAWQLEQAPDWKGRETELLPANTFLRWLGTVQPVISSHSFNASSRARKLRGVWREQWELAVEEDFTEFVERRKQLPAKSKITGAMVQVLFAARRDGATFTEAARAAGIAVSTAKAVAADRYPMLSDEARVVWEKTFGAFPEPEKPVRPSNSSKRAGGGT